MREGGVRRAAYSGLMSLCTNPQRCKCWIPVAIWMKISLASSSINLSIGDVTTLVYKSLIKDVRSPWGRGWNQERKAYPQAAYSIIIHICSGFSITSRSFTKLGWSMCFISAYLNRNRVRKLRNEECNTNKKLRKKKKGANLLALNSYQIFFKHFFLMNDFNGDMLASPIVLSQNHLPSCALSYFWRRNVKREEGYFGIVT